MYYLLCFSDFVGLKSDGNSDYELDTQKELSRIVLLSYMYINPRSEQLDDKNAFKLFVDSCLEIVMQDGNCVSNSKDFDELIKTEQNGFRIDNNDLTLEVKQNGIPYRRTQKYIMKCLINGIIKQMIPSEIRNKKFTLVCSPDVINDTRTKQIREAFSKCRIDNISFMAHTEYHQILSIRHNPQGLFKSGYHLITHCSQNEFDEYFYSCGGEATLGVGSVTGLQSELTILCDAGIASQHTLFSSRDNAVDTKVFFPFSISNRMFVVINFYSSCKDFKEKPYFIGGIQAEAIRNEVGLPPLILFLRSGVSCNHQIICFKLMDTKTLKFRSFFYGDWEKDSLVNDDKWDHTFPIVDQHREDCLLSTLQMVDNVIVQGSDTIFRGRIYDLNGEIAYEGEVNRFNGVSSSSPTYNSTTDNHGLLLSALANDTLSTYVAMHKTMCFPPDFNRMEMITLRHSWKCLNTNAISNRDHPIGLCIDEEWCEVYIGQVNNNQIPDRYGMILGEYDKIIYIGNMKNGQLNGKGKLYTMPFIPRDFVIVGDFEENEVIGQFEVRNRYSDILYFRGTFQNDKQFAEGSIFYNNVKIFEGIVSCGSYNMYIPEKGTIYYLSGSKKYSGRIVNGLAEGIGEMYYYTSNNNNIILYDNRVGVIAEESRIKYRGSFTHGLKNGVGVEYGNTHMVIPLYSGEYVNGKRHGKGILCVSPFFDVVTHRKIKGITQEETYAWKTGKEIKNILYFEGEFRDGLPIQGRVVFCDRSEANVVRHDDVLIGNSIMINTSFLYQGNFSMNSEWKFTFEGIVRFYKDNLVFQGFYDNQKHCLNNDLLLYTDTLMKSKPKLFRFTIEPNNDDWTFFFTHKQEFDSASCEYSEIFENR